MQLRKCAVFFHKGLEGHPAVFQQLPYVHSPLPLDHLDPGNGGAPGGNGLGELEGDPLPSGQPLSGQVAGTFRPQLQGTPGWGRRLEGDARQLQQLAPQRVGKLVHVVLLHLFVPGHQLQNGDAWVVGIVIRPHRTQKGQTALCRFYDFLIGLVVQISGAQHGPYLLLVIYDLLLHLNQVQSAFYCGIGEEAVLLQRDHPGDPGLVKLTLQQDAAYQVHVGGVPHRLPHLGDADLVTDVPLPPAAR